MRKKLIDSTKADIKKYMMIVESAGKVPASTREDFELEDIENPYFQGDEDTEESEGNRYYITVGVKIGYDENTDSYFPEVIWDQETGTEIEFDKLDKISKKSIQDKCDQVGSKIHVQRRDVYEEADYSDEFTVHYRFKNRFGGMSKQFVTVKAKTPEEAASQVLTTLKQKSYRSPQIVSSTPYQEGDRRSNATNQTEELGESTQIVVKALMQKFKISESKAKSIVAKVSESLVFENTIDNKTFETKLKGSISTILKKYGFEDTGRAGWVKEFGQRKTLGRIYLKSYQGTKKKYSIYPDQIETQEYYLESEHSPSKDVIGMYDLNEATPEYLDTLCKKISDGMNRYYGVK